MVAELAHIIAVEAGRQMADGCQEGQNPCHVLGKGILCLTWDPACGLKDIQDFENGALCPPEHGLGLE